LSEGSDSKETSEESVALFLAFHGAVDLGGLVDEDEDLGDGDGVEAGEELGGFVHINIIEGKKNGTNLCESHCKA